MSARKEELFPPKAFRYVEIGRWRGPFPAVIDTRMSTSDALRSRGAPGLTIRVSVNEMKVDRSTLLLAAIARIPEVHIDRPLARTARRTRVPIAAPDRDRSTRDRAVWPVTDALAVVHTGLDRLGLEVPRADSGHPQVELDAAGAWRLAGALASGLHLVEAVVRGTEAFAAGLRGRLAGEHDAPPSGA